MLELNNDILISIQDISKKFGDQKVLTDIDLDINHYEILGILGKSGCGKSTLIKILLGFYKPDSGKILYNNLNLVVDFKKIRDIVGFVSQENSFYEKLTVEENLFFFANLYNIPKEEAISRGEFLLNLVKLSEHKNRLAENLSGGMKRRLEFAISLIHDPKILVLDEPFNGLDIQISEEIWYVIEKIKSSGVTIIVITHILNSLSNHCDRAVFMSEGKIIKEVSNVKKSRIDLEKIFREVLL